MKVLSKILWAIDFDVDHGSSIIKIRNMASQFGNEIILLHVLPKKIRESSIRELVEKSVKTELEEVKDRLTVTEQFDIESRIVYGNVVDQIIDVSEEEDVNIIIVNRGKGASENRNSLGLNAQRVFRNSHKPVAIISESLPMVENHIVCPVDCSEPSAIALKSAIIHAKKANAMLTVLSVFEGISHNSSRTKGMWKDEEKENEWHFSIFKNEFEEFIRKIDFRGLIYETVLLEGIPHEQIINYSKKASLLYIGSTGKSGLRRTFLGSVTEKVIDEVTCNVITMKTEELFKLRIPRDIVDIEHHFNRAKELREMGLLVEAVAEYKLCLQVNDLHLPSIYYLSDLYELLGDKSQAEYYLDLSKIVIAKMTDRRIEDEIRRHYNK